MKQLFGSAAWPGLQQGFGGYMVKWLHG